MADKQPMKIDHPKYKASGTRISILTVFANFNKIKAKMTAPPGPKDNKPAYKVGK